MPLAHRDDQFQYDPQLGIFRFTMQDGSTAVPCMVTEIALRLRAGGDNTFVETPEELFLRYRFEVEALAAQLHEQGQPSPIVRAVDLVRPPPLPGRVRPPALRSVNL